jgi:hypothetical protein
LVSGVTVFALSKADASLMKAGVSEPAASDLARSLHPQTAPGSLVILAQTGTPPVLMAIEPSTGPAGAAYPLTVTIRGTGFAATGNLVQFGPAMIPDVSATEGRIEFAAPKGMQSRSEVPPMVFPPGEYPVTVTTPAGTSNALTFTLTR